VLNGIALVNTRYMDRAIGPIPDRTRTVDDHDLERLSPLIQPHIELHGRYSFSLPETVRPASSARSPRSG